MKALLDEPPHILSSKTLKSTLPPLSAPQNVLHRVNLAGDAGQASGRHSCDGRSELAHGALWAAGWR